MNSCRGLLSGRERFSRSFALPRIAFPYPLPLTPYPCTLRNSALPAGHPDRHDPGMSAPERSPHDYTHSEEFLQTLMRRQLRLSVACALTFLVALLGLPVLNYFVPELMARRIGGYPLTWLLLGVLFFPFVWIIAWVFIRRSIALEEAEVREVKSRGQNETGRK
jgi:uncharacterized membrane protein (DUF485 family)